jgi:hypothetical protein
MLVNENVRNKKKEEREALGHKKKNERTRHHPLKEGMRFLIWTKKG